MDSRIQQLIAAFETNGWKYDGVVDVVSDWWFADVLAFTSVWHPTNKNLYLTLLTDPQDIKKKIIWNIGISITLPNSKDTNYIENISLNDIKKTDLVSFVEGINKQVLVK